MVLFLNLPGSTVRPLHHLLLLLHGLRAPCIGNSLRDNLCGVLRALLSVLGVVLVY